MSAVTARLYTDPACPPDPEWLRLLWQHGDRVATELRMVVLRESRTDDWGVPGSDATIHACRAVVAAGLRWPDRQMEFLRHLRVLSAAGEALDDSDTLEIAAERTGLPVAEIAAYCAEPEVEAALQAQRGGECGVIEVDGALDAPRPPAATRPRSSTGQGCRSRPRRSPPSAAARSTSSSSPTWPTAPTGIGCPPTR